MIPTTDAPVNSPPSMFAIPSCGKYNAYPSGADIDDPSFTFIIVFPVFGFAFPAIPYPSSAISIFP